MKKADDIIFSEIESDSDGYESFYRYGEVVKAIKAAQIDAIEATVLKCSENVTVELTKAVGVEGMYLFGIDIQSILNTAEQLKKELE